jgi:hypothetical protein
LCESQWMLKVSFCPTGEPKGTDFRASVSLLFPTQSEISASRLFFLPPTFTLASCSAHSSTLKMEAICSSETSGNFQRATRCYIPEERTLHNHRCENLKSLTTSFINIHWALWRKKDSHITIGVRSSTQQISVNIQQISYSLDTLCICVQTEKFCIEAKVFSVLNDEFWKI